MRTRAKKIIALFDSAVANEQRYEFQNAKRYYSKIVEIYPNSPEAGIARERIQDMDALSREKRIYKRIDRNARRVLTEIGIDISSNPELMKILMDADAIDFNNEHSLYIPLTEEYVDSCLAEVPTYMAEDPGENAFGTGATPPFLLRPDRQDVLAPATRLEFEEIVQTAAEYTDTLGIFSIPVATDKSIDDFECSRLMEQFSDLKMTYTKNMTDEETAYFRNRDDWLDGTSLITSLTYMPSMVAPFIRSIQSGNNVLLLDLTIAGSTGPISPEALLTQIHAQVLFMMILAQTINPNVSCVHGGIPDVLGISGDLCYSDPSQPIINSAMARLNMWVTGFPSAQSGGSTSIINDIPAAVEESELSRNTLREYGVHILRHAMGAMGSLNYFSLEKFIQDCERERESRRIMLKTRHDFVVPLYFPEDKHVLSGIREIAVKGGAKNADHTLNNTGAFMKWQKQLIEMSEKKVYYPEFRNSLQKHKKNIDRTTKGERVSQLQDTLFPDGDIPTEEI
ncbi:trimethylamine methyltransferase family protein [Desulfopila inferna]|uniref:trimethylamine methyltransferase family protein n=1 Tax=Desulfopila inferna TaxID=468528 RepID=UPI0019625D6C|nr:trimethylamine methyltransferase family protein [Desulfopila inferna]MBM9602615.1 trimethylamine methyltransferase family protein [Desulfopila inferna]